MPSLGAVAATGFLRELRTQVRSDGKEMRRNDWTMMLAAAEVFVRCGIKSVEAKQIHEAEKKVGGRRRALAILTGDEDLFVSPDPAAGPGGRYR